MIHHQFAQQVVDIIKKDTEVIGLAVAGSWLTNELDEFSDLDLILVTRSKISHDKNLMLEYAGKFGNLLSGFTGEHVGEPRVLICLYSNPLLHVDIKFLTIDEFEHRVEEPVILYDADGQLQQVLNQTHAVFPYPDYQWIEDRFWIWVHYALLKIGRGENMEALDFFGFLRMVVLGPLLHIKNGNLPRGVRRVETQLSATDHEKLMATIPVCQKASLLSSLEASILLYSELRVLLFDDKVVLRVDAEKEVMAYFETI